MIETNNIRILTHSCDRLSIENSKDYHRSNSNRIETVDRDHSISSIHEFSVEDTSEIPQQCNGQNGSNKKPRFYRRQWLVLITLAYGNFWIAACVSLQAPFFPREAELKGATPTQYGLVFGIYELVICVTSPVFGKLITCVSPNFICEAGLFVAGASTILFGVLDRVPNGTPFITLCFIIRIIEGIASAAFMTASYTVMASEFPDRVATTFSLLETCFGLGLIMGPTVGGAFYQLGGFTLPFTLLGVFLLAGGIVTLLLMPKSGQSGNLIKFMSDPSIMLDALSIITALNFIGFNAATLEPHLRQFELSPVLVGCIFVITGATYAVTTPIWGKLCDSGYDPKLICAVGCVLCCVGFILIGPLPIINFKPKLWIIIVSLLFIGLGISSKLVSAFINALHDSIKRRHFPDDMSTYGLVSAMFFSSCSIGAFVGPSLGGFLLEKIGYRNGTIIILVTDIILLILVVIYMIFRKCSAVSQTNRRRLNFEREPLLKRRESINSKI